MPALTSTATGRSYQSATALAVGAAHRLFAAQQNKPPIADQNSSVGQYSQSPDGLVHVRFYNSPVAIAADAAHGGWRLRGTRLTPTADGGYAPADEPFNLRFDAHTPQATLTSEDGDTLQVALAALGGQAPALDVGQVAGNAITYPTLAPSSTGDVSLRATPAGVDVRVVLHNSAASGQISLAVTTDPTQHDTLHPLSDGRIRVEHPVQDCGSQGCRTITQPSFFIERSIAQDNNADPAALFSGTASLTSTVTPGTNQLMLTLDQSWLHDPARQFPVTVDLPILTIAAVTDTGGFGTISSCAPTVPAPATSVLVGNVGACAYHGILYFDVSTLVTLDQLSLQSATLDLYTPGATGSTGVLLYPNVPGPLAPPPPPPPPPPTTFPIAYPTGAPTPAPPPPFPAIQDEHQPSWNDAPAIISGTTGLAPVAGQGHWQQWDVLAQVRDWLANVRTNTGLTLVGPAGAAPVLFASPLGRNDHGPDRAPHLEMTFAVPSASGTITPNTVCGVGSCTYSDGAHSIYGIDDGVNNFGRDLNTLETSIVRINAGSPPCGIPYLGGNMWGATYTAMQNAYNDHLIPLVTFVQNASCVNNSGSENLDWAGAMQAFAYYLPSFGTVCISNGAGGCTTSTPDPPMYFEIGNEVDLPTTSNYALHWTQLYPPDFDRAAAALNLFLGDGVGRPAYDNFHIITDGITSPWDGSSCGDQQTYQTAHDAISAAMQDPYYPVPPARLGAGIHPYGDNSLHTQPSYWNNYRQYFGASCPDISTVIFQWRMKLDSLAPGVEFPIVMTEVNYTPTPSCYSTAYDTQRDGSYLIDLMTWLYDNYGYYNFTSYPVRVIWYEGADTKYSPQCQGGISFGDFPFNVFVGWHPIHQGTNEQDPQISSTQAHSGLYSAALGTFGGPNEPLGDQCISQNFTTPGGTLVFWYWTFTTDNVAFDWQEADIRPSDTAGCGGGPVTTRLFRKASNDKTWEQFTMNLAAGSYQIYFDVHEDGFGDPTAMYVDDVCVSAKPAPYACDTGSPFLGIFTASGYSKTLVSPDPNNPAIQLDCYSLFRNSTNWSYNLDAFYAYLGADAACF